MPTQRIVLAALTLAALVVTSACGTSAVSSPMSSAAAAPQASHNGSPPAAAPALAGDWQGFRGDPSHTGIAAAGPVGHPVLNWQYHARSAVPDAISVVGDQVSFASDDGSVYALDRATGKERWVVSAGPGPIIGPWAADGRLYLVNGAGHALALTRERAARERPAGAARARSGPPA